MAGDVIANKIQLGDSATASNNFHIVNNVDGSMSINRGNVGSSLGEVLTVNSDNTLSQNGRPASVARAWVNFDGTGATGAKTPRGSFNIASVVKNSTGNYTITFTEPMSSPNYSFTISAIPASGYASTGSIPSTPTTSSFTYISTNAGGSAYDCPYVSIVFFE